MGGWGKGVDGADRKTGGQGIRLRGKRGEGGEGGRG